MWRSRVALVLMIVEIDRTAGIVTKRAETASEMVRLRREAAVLAEARHPGVVELIGFAEPAELRLRAADGGPLEGHGQLTVAEIAALGAQVATTLADLHDIGVIHGALTAPHVLMEPDGRAILCSFGQGADRSRADDVAALGRLLASLDPASSAHLLDKAIAQATRSDPRRRPTARTLARRLAAIATGPDARPVPWPVALVALVALVSLLVLVALLGPVLSRPGSPSSPVAPSCPPVDLGCGPVSRPGGVVTTATGQYQLSEPGDPVVLGRWTCRRTAFPALLRLTTGQVWLWDTWPRAHTGVSGRLVTRIAGATSLHVLHGANTSISCDKLVVSRAAGPPVVVPLPLGRPPAAQGGTN